MKNVHNSYAFAASSMAKSGNVSRRRKAPPVLLPEPNEKGAIIILSILLLLGFALIAGLMYSIFAAW